MLFCDVLVEVVNVSEQGVTTLYRTFVSTH
jgi:hypothetical protein